MAWREKGLGLVRVAENLGQLDLLLRRQGLLAEEEHLELEQRLAQFGAQALVAEMGQIDVVHGGTDVRGVGFDGQMRVAGNCIF